MVYSKVLKLYAMKGGYYNMQAKMNNWVQFAVLGLLVGSILMTGFDMSRDNEVTVSVNNDELLNGIQELLANQDGSSNEDLLDNLNRLCELTDGCEFFAISNSEASPVRDIVEDEEDEFVEAFSELVGISDKYLDIKRIELLDTQVRAYSENNRDDENFEVKLFYKIKFRDVDDDDNQYAYVLVTSELDEGDFDELSLEMVDREFEFD